MFHAGSQTHSLAPSDSLSQIMAAPMMGPQMPGMMPGAGMMSGGMMPGGMMPGGMPGGMMPGGMPGMMPPMGHPGGGMMSMGMNNPMAYGSNGSNGNGNARNVTSRHDANGRSLFRPRASSRGRLRPIIQTFSNAFRSRRSVCISYYTEIQMFIRSIIGYGSPMSPGFGMPPMGQPGMHPGGMMGHGMHRGMHPGEDFDDEEGYMPGMGGRPGSMMYGQGMHPQMMGPGSMGGMPGQMMMGRGALPGPMPGPFMAGAQHYPRPGMGSPYGLYGQDEMGNYGGEEYSESEDFSEYSGSRGYPVHYR
ncbi:hypothetical protein C8J56DRAFT_1163455 [Mycena floridula]|nr:hypothetical protein C8J56DRAFT_1163455 [Mycena floridula]